MEIVRTHHANLIVDPDRVYIKGPLADQTLRAIAQFAASGMNSDLSSYWDWTVELLPGDYAVVTLYKD